MSAMISSVIHFVMREFNLILFLKGDGHATHVDHENLEPKKGYHLNEMTINNYFYCQFIINKCNKERKFFTFSYKICLKWVIK